MKAFHEIRNYISDFKVWYSSYGNICFVAHWHKEIELIYVKNGSACVHVNNQTFLAQQGDLILCDSGDIHYCDDCSKDSQLDFIIFDTSILYNTYQYTHFEQRHITRECLDHLCLTDSFLRLIFVLQEELGNRNIYYRDIVKANIQSFWFRLKRSIPISDLEAYSQNKRASRLNDFQKILSFMETHYAEAITLETVADSMNFSPSHFSKVFKQLIGTNFVKYLNLIRISQAAEELRKNPGKITSVAFDCGFNNIRTFNRVFKEITGYTPSALIALPESTPFNFSYYKSGSSISAYSGEDPHTIISL